MRLTLLNFSHSGALPFPFAPLLSLLGSLITHELSRGKHCCRGADCRYLTAAKERGGGGGRKKSADVASAKEAGKGRRASHEQVEEEGQVGFRVQRGGRGGGETDVILAEASRVEGWGFRV